MIVELEKGVWLADSKGDPAITLKIENAKEFLNMKEALAALDEARKYRPFKNAKVTEGFF